MPSNLSPTVLLSDRDKFKFRRGYAADLCWNKYIEEGEERWTAPVGDWDEINWQETFEKHVPTGTTFYEMPEYLIKLRQRQLGASIEVEEDRNN